MSPVEVFGEFNADVQGEQADGGSEAEGGRSVPDGGSFVREEDAGLESAVHRG